MTITTLELRLGVGLVLAIIETFIAVTGIGFASLYTHTKKTRYLVICIVLILLVVVLFFATIYILSTNPHNMA